METSTFVKAPEWIKNKRRTINPQNKDNKCFQYSVTLSLYHNQINNNLQRISKTKRFIKNFYWKNINFPPTQQDYQQFEINNKSIALNILKMQEQKKISHYYQSKYNKIRENKVILLMITDNNKQHIFVKKLNALLKNKNNHHVNYFCINCLKKFITTLGHKNIIKKIVKINNNFIILTIILLKLTIIILLKITIIILSK